MSTNRQWGIRMGGSGEGLEQLIKQHVPIQTLKGNRATPYTLIEVGSANCVSLRAFADILKETLGVADWRAIGFDLTPDKAWSLDMTEVEKAFVGYPYQVWTENVAKAWAEDAKGMALMLFDQPRLFLANRVRGESFSHLIDFAFIDGCHGKCAGLDFLVIEDRVAPGGIVAFHDYGEIETGTDLQPHCREFINVRSYVHRLGLATPSPSGTTRKGWRWVGEIAGSRKWGLDGNSCAVVQRTAEPLENQPELSID